MIYFIGGAIVVIGFVGFKIGLYYRDAGWKRRIRKALKKADSMESLEAILLDNGKEEDI